MKTKILKLDASEVGDIELDDAIFGLEPRSDLIQRVVVWQLAKRRAGTHKTQTRAEVNRTKKKLYRQKGTGQARHGARSAPNFVGGGKAMGPVNHSHAFDLPKKVRALGLRHALSAKAKEGAIVVLDEAKSVAMKTKELAQQFGKLGVADALIVDGEFDLNFAMSARNLNHVYLLPAEGLNVYDILRRDKLVLTKAAVKVIEERLS
ncbi:MAG: 50S ribosomal protein L4 [Alphaproteobacteria bacterium]|nr:50S ribosomal protein L4 [Alphaproteobacteria bacterium]MDE2013497.1 50S ribosomal protein L4 [Alphaproteobacteria bacterium]MDE2072655.1 50S ribosomal protein L4 [Alphaproteobacteria bacterium]MDE2352165.1 50S ribosomal protein L4 [Alphaproteobacteria bacterium]